MTLHPHVHLLVPSSDPKVLLETRLYLHSFLQAASPTLSSLISTSSSSSPVPHPDLPSIVKDELKALGIRRIVTAAHPWGRLGGNMLDPVLAHHLIDSAYSVDEAAQPPSSSRATSTAVVTYNVRGVGLSQGSSAWLTPGNDPSDFAAIEQWAVDVLAAEKSEEGPDTDVCRLGYSWGCIAAVLAPLPSACQVRSIMLVSPPLSFLPAVTYFSGSFDSALRRLVQTGVPTSTSTEGQSGKPVEFWTIYGDSDEFTGVAKYHTWVEGLAGMKAMEVEGDHFWRGAKEGRELREWMGRWLMDGGAE